MKSRLVVIVALLAEAVVFVMMGTMRYGNQGLPPAMFDVTQTGNVLALLFLVLYAWSALRLLFRRDVPMAGLVWLAGSTAASLTLLALCRVVHVRDLETYYMVFGVMQLCILGLITSLVSRDETHLVLRTAQHAGIIAMFVFAGTIGYGVMTPTDVPADHRADAAVILGAAVWSHNRPSPLLRMRISKANDLLRTKIVSTIVCTGSNALGERPEADVERTELIKMGVDSNAIITESRTNSTIAQVMYLRDSLQRRGLRTFVIVSDHFHLQRALEMCRFNGLTARGAASESLLPWPLLGWYRVRDAAAMLLYWMLGT